MKLSIKLTLKTVNLLLTMRPNERPIDLEHKALKYRYI